MDSGEPKRGVSYETQMGLSQKLQNNTHNLLQVWGYSAQISNEKSELIRTTIAPLWFYLLLGSDVFLESVRRLLLGG